MNKKYKEGGDLTYKEGANSHMLSFVNNLFGKHQREGGHRQRGFSMRRIFYVPPRSGELYCLRYLLNFMRGATSFDDIKTVDGVLNATFRDA